MQAISASLRDMLDLQYGVTVGDAETKRAVEKYLSGVSTRVASLDSPTEVTRVLKTLLHAAYRDLSEALANKALEEPTLEDLPSPE